MTTHADPPRSHGQRRLALIVLGAAAGLAVIAAPVRATWWGGFLLAIAEAGIIGGLADWFAVTAIFRHPLGLPIPHTALISANWELMAARVGTMVGDRVLSKAYVTGEVERIDVADLLARGAAKITRDDLESLTRTLARFIADEFPATAGRDATARVRRVLANWPMAPLVAAALDTARQHGWDQRAIAGILRAIVDALDRPHFRRAVEDGVEDLLVRYRAQMSPYPRLFIGLAHFFGLIDRERIVDALGAGLGEAAGDPEHPLRKQLTQVLTEMPDRLRSDPAFAARLEAVKSDFLESAVLGLLLDDVMTELRRMIDEDLARDRPEIVVWIADRLERGRQTIAADAALRRDVDRWIKLQVTSFIDRHHARIATFIENGVRSLGPEGAVRLIEEHAGDDLQYIRVNGTVVGGLAGGALYALHLVLGWL